LAFHGNFSISSGKASAIPLCALSRTNVVKKILYIQTELSYKATKTNSLDEEEKEYNQALSRLRVVIEPILGDIKTFKNFSGSVIDNNLLSQLSDPFLELCFYTTHF
jgi:hypothetical protein